MSNYQNPQNFNPNQQQYSTYPNAQNNYFQNLNQLKKAELEQIKAKLAQKKNAFSLGSILYVPDKFSFATQNPTEEILVILRRHWIKNLGWIINNTIYSLIPLVLIYFYNYFNIDIEFINARTVGIFLLAYYSLIATNVVKDFFDWYFDPYIITNERIVEYEFKPFTSYRIKETMMQSLDIIKEDTTGLSSTLFNYGDVVLVTEAQHLEFNFKSVPNPTEIRNLIADLSNIAKKYDR